LFWTKVSTRFCAITDQGLLLIYGEKEKGIAIDLKTVRSVHSNIAEKKLNGTLVRTSVGGSRRIRRSASYGEPEGAKFQFSTPTDPDEVDYWNSPEAGKQMTSPKIYRALSHHALMHRVRSSSLRPAFSASLTFTASNTKRTPTEFGKGQTNVDVVGLREVCTLPRRASLRKPFVPAIILGSFRKERFVTQLYFWGKRGEVLLKEATYVTAKSDEGNGTSAEISEAPSPAFSIDSGVVSRADSPSKNGAHEQTEERDCIVRDDSVRSNCSRNVEETVKESANISRSVPKAYLPTQAKNASIILPILIADDLNIEGIFEEVLRYLKDDCSHWR
uniref:SAC domain-containing protein n=1 Tax=Toxocara canis TaxID=6265 RepID=A0A183VB93_TOXCA